MKHPPTTVTKEFKNKLLVVKIPQYLKDRKEKYKDTATESIERENNNKKDLEVKKATEQSNDRPEMSTQASIIGEIPTESIDKNGPGENLSEDSEYVSMESENPKSSEYVSMDEEQPMVDGEDYFLQDEIENTKSSEYISMEIY